LDFFLLKKNNTQHNELQFQAFRYLLMLGYALIPWHSKHEHQVKTLTNESCHLEPLINSDPGGCWWPPTYPIWTPTTVSFNFSVSLIIAQFTIFNSFLGPKLPKPFWGPKRCFLGNLPPTIFRLFHRIPQRDLSNGLSCASNGDNTTNSRPREVDVPTYPKQGPQFGISSSRVRFWNVKGFPLFLNNK